MYGHALDRMEDTPEPARKLMIPQIQSLLYSFDGNKAYSHDTVEFPVRAIPFNIVTEFCVLEVQFSYAILGRPWIHMMRAVQSTHHQLLKYPILKYPTPSGTTNIRGDQAMARMVAA